MPDLMLLWWALLAAECVGMVGVLWLLVVLDARTAKRAPLEWGTQ